MTPSGGEAKYLSDHSRIVGHSILERIGYGYIRYSGIPVTSGFAGCMVSEPTLLYVITWLYVHCTQLQQKLTKWALYCHVKLSVNRAFERLFPYSANIGVFLVA